VAESCATIGQVRANSQDTRVLLGRRRGNEQPPPSLGEPRRHRGPICRCIPHLCRIWGRRMASVCTGEGVLPFRIAPDRPATLRIDSVATIVVWTRSQGTSDADIFDAPPSVNVVPVTGPACTLDGGRWSACRAACLSRRSGGGWFARRACAPGGTRRPGVCVIPGDTAAWNRGRLADSSPMAAAG
jgi:hypothetical protein